MSHKHSSERNLSFSDYDREIIRSLSQCLSFVGMMLILTSSWEALMFLLTLLGGINGYAFLHMISAPISFFLGRMTLKAGEAFRLSLSRSDNNIKNLVEGLRSLRGFFKFHVILFYFGLALFLAWILILLLGRIRV